MPIDLSLLSNPVLSALSVGALMERARSHCAPLAVADQIGHCTASWFVITLHSCIMVLKPSGQDRLSIATSEQGGADFRSRLQSKKRNGLRAERSIASEHKRGLASTEALLRAERGRLQSKSRNGLRAERSIASEH